MDHRQKRTLTSTLPVRVNEIQKTRPRFFRNALQLAPLKEDEEGRNPADMQEQEHVPVKTRRSPEQPTRDEVEQHNSHHEPYRSWCPACVAGRGQSFAHSMVALSTDCLLYTSPSPRDTERS
eukprot:449498-Karenia_brevis.AAC.1